MTPQDKEAKPATPEQFLREFVYGWLVEVAFGVYDHEDLPKLADKMLEEFAKLLELREQEAETVGRVKELEAGDILPDFAFDNGCEWFIQGVKVPKYLARKISDAAKERRSKLLASLTTPNNTSNSPQQPTTDELDAILAAHDGYTLEEYRGLRGGHNYSQNDNAVKAKAAIISWADKRQSAAIREAEQRPVGDAIEISVEPEVMRFVLARCKQSDKTIARRVLEPGWRIDDWRKNGGEIYIWKLKILASLTRRFSWSVFLLKSDNLVRLPKDKGEESL